VTFTTQPALTTLHGNGGNDFVSADGMDITGVPGPANYPVSLFGDADNDLLAGGGYSDFLAGGPGDDRYVTSDDHAGGDWLTEKPAEGSDTATINPGDTVNGEIEGRFVQFPVGKLKLAHAGMTAGRTAQVKLAWWHPKAWKDLRSLTVRLSEGGKAVTADLALTLDRSLAHHTLRIGVEATDRAGHRQDDALAGALTVR
jgi:Ca2+-binding RTX toxin-like protein